MDARSGQAAGANSGALAAESSVTPMESFETSVPLVQADNGASSAGGALPVAPRSSGVLKVLVRKHILVAKKRRRLLTSLWPALLYSGVAGIFYSILDGIDNKSLLGLLLALVLPIYMNLAVQGALVSSVAEIVAEKESKMKVVQEIYGVSKMQYIGSWAVYYSCVALVNVTVIMVVLYVVRPVFATTQPILVFTIFIVAYIQQYEFSFMASTFFDKQQTASACIGVLNLLLLFIATGAQAWLQGQVRLLWYACSLLPSVNVMNSLSAVMWAQVFYTCTNGVCLDQGLGFHNLFAKTLCAVQVNTGEICPKGMEKEIFSAGECITMMLLDVVLYFVIAWWLENIWQGEFGNAKPLCFCFDPAFICPRRAEYATVQQPQEAGGPRLALSIHRLRKVFKNKVAVDDLTLDVHSGEIFALLGHNGAGKTTSINCIIGMVPMTSGEAVVNGFDSGTDIMNVRRSLSICPQDNPLYDVKTVRQHLNFFAGIRGISEDHVAHRIDSVLSALGIQEKVDDLCTSLSGGQKRRLWVATALLGNTPVVFLDEPTSGMDPASRHELWKLFIAMKAAGTTIIFTTHYLEEADILANRKAILARGRCQAVGTSRDLKLHYGLGYCLRIDFVPALGEDEFNKASTDVLSLARRHVPAVTVEGLAEEERMQAADAARAICLRLPFADVPQFGPLLSALEEDMARMRISDFNLAMSTLEEVFLALGRQAEQEAGTLANNVDFRELEREVAHEGMRLRQTPRRRAAGAMCRVRLEQIFGNKRACYSVFILPTLLNFVCFWWSSSGGSNIQLAIYPPMAFGISTFASTAGLIYDKQHKIKHVAMAQGLQPRSYWAGNLVAHYLCLLPVAFVLIGMVQWKKPEGIYDKGTLMLCLEALIYPIGLILWAYNASTFFQTVEVAMKVLPLMNLFLGTIPTVAVAVMWQLPVEKWQNVAKAIHVVMSLLNPIYNLPGMLVSLQDAPPLDEGIASDFKYFGMWCGVPFFGGLVQIALYSAHLIWKDTRSYSATPGSLADFSHSRKDSDVLEEEHRITNTAGEAPRDEAVRYQRLSHSYRTKVNGKWLETHAVRDISLGIRSGECFGLLGPNGAGKTTTLAVLTGEVRPPTAGRVCIYGNDISTSKGLLEAYKMLGVCPQVDPLWETITGRGHLYFYGRVKGVPEESLQRAVDTLLYRLGFENADANKPASQYSGGMKRKLSLGIALIGQSPLMFLDEPSAGVDAGAKRHLWKVIKLRTTQQTVVVTTHSMEEAEALCDRIGIQVKGQLRCLGSPNHIKNIYGTGYQLEVFCRPGANEDIACAFVQQKVCPEVELLERHAGHLVFQLPPFRPHSRDLGEANRRYGDQKPLTLGGVFTVLQEHMTIVGISDYSVTQPSLEQVFLRFAKEQDESEAAAMVG